MTFRNRLVTLLALVCRSVRNQGLTRFTGYLWKNGWESGAFVAPLYSDVVPELRAWHGSGKQIVIFSSGSVDAQKLLFGHAGTEEGDQSTPSAPESTEKKRKPEPVTETKVEDEAEPAAKKVKTVEPEKDTTAEVPNVETPAVASQDLNPIIADYFDTQNAGPKQEKASYEKIAKALGKECSEILFLSDNVKGAL